MKKYVLLSLIALKLANMSCLAMESIGNDSGEQKHFNPLTVRQAKSAVEYFNAEKMKYQDLQTLDKKFCFLDFALRSLEKTPQININLIIANFIQATVQSIIINSDINKPLPRLVETLDPIWHDYAGVPKYTPLLPLVNENQ